MESAKQQLKDTFTEYWKYLALNAACELELFDKIEEEEHSIHSISEKYKWNSNSIENLIGFCIHENYLSYSKKGKLQNTETGKLLVKNNPDGLHHACLLWADEHMTAWQNLAFSIKSGKTSFSNSYGKPYFDYLKDKPQASQLYHKAIHEYARDDYAKITDIHDFSIHKSIMDVGGSHGALIQQIKNNYPNINCYLFDLKNVISSINIENIHLIAGDFFKGIPPCSDAILLSRVLHDWDEEYAIRILDNCYKALPANGQIYIIEILTDKLEEQPYLLNLNMKVMCNSYERTEKQYATLLQKSGFKTLEIKSLNQLQSIIIANK